MKKKTKFMIGILGIGILMDSGASALQIFMFVTSSILYILHLLGLTLLYIALTYFLNLIPVRYKGIKILSMISCTIAYAANFLCNLWFFIKAINKA